MQAPQRQLFQQMLFAKIVPNCKKLGLLDAGATNGKPGWRERFQEARRHPVRAGPTPVVRDVQLAQGEVKLRALRLTAKRASRDTTAAGEVAT